MIMRGEVQRGSEINCYCPVCQPTGESKDKRLYYHFDGEKLLAHCKHGCSFEDIAKFFPKENGEQSNEWLFLREHVYFADDGSIFGKKIYYQVNGKKRPIWQRFENGEYITGLEGLKAGLYNVVELAKNPDDTVFIVEGEKDVDTLKKHGLLAISPPNGAGYWKAAYNQYFKKRNVVVIPDNDEQGRKHLEKVAKNLVKSAKSVRLLDLTDLVPELKKGGDVSDIFEELPNAKDLLLQLVTETESEQVKNLEICFITNDAGKPLKTFDNFKLLLRHYGIEIKNNSILGIEFSGKLPRMTDENTLNVTLAHLYSLSRETGINFSKTEISDYTIMEADCNHYNPIGEWFKTLDITGKGYIKKYFDCLMFDEIEETNKQMYLALFVKWLVQCVALQFNEIKNPAGADGALGLQSQNEGIGKTSFFKNLCFEPRFFKDGVSLDTANKDSVINATSFWICELGEVESTLSKDLAKLKAFITEDYDTYRIPYATGKTTKPRRTSFCFTCNSSRFLKDGDNRRFWTIPIVNVDLKKLKAIDMKKLWGETYTLYCKKPQGYRLTRDELAFLRENNREKFGFRSNEEEVLRDKMIFAKPEEQWSYMTATDISSVLFDDKNHARMIGKILSENMGYLPKNAGKMKHFRIYCGRREYFVPLKNLINPMFYKY